jgi:hypothetical protein
MLLDYLLFLLVSVAVLVVDSTFRVYVYDHMLYVPAFSCTKINTKINYFSIYIE